MTTRKPTLSPAFCEVESNSHRGFTKVHAYCNHNNATANDQPPSAAVIKTPHHVHLAARC